MKDLLIEVEEVVKREFNCDISLQDFSVNKYIPKNMIDIVFRTSPDGDLDTGIRYFISGYIFAKIGQMFDVV